MDHTIELTSEESSLAVPEMKNSLKKVRRLVDYMVDSASAREKLYDLMVEAGERPLAIIQGTSNR